MSVKMDEMFSITRSSRFSSSHIVRHILVVMCKKRLVAIAAVRFGPIALSKVAETFNSKIGIRMDLATDLTFRADSVSKFDHLTLAVASVCVTSMIFLTSMIYKVGFL